MECVFYDQCPFISFHTDINATTDGISYHHDQFTAYTTLHCNGPLRSTCMQRRAIFANEQIDPRLTPDGTFLPLLEIPVETEETQTA